MRFTVRSLGGKLVISAALMLLLCMLLFSVTSWFFLKTFYELEARRDAVRHLESITRAYQTKIDLLKEGLTTEAAKSVIVAALTNIKPSARAQVSRELAYAKGQYHLSSVSIISMEDTDEVGKIQIEDGDIDPSSNLSLISHTLGSESISALQIADLEVA